MSTLAFDTHKAVKTLRETGFEEAQAEAVVATVGAALTENMATKSDVTPLKTDVAALKIDVAALKTDVAALKTDVAALKADVTALKADIDVLRAELKADMKGLESRIYAAVIIGVGLIKALDFLIG